MKRHGRPKVIVTNRLRSNRAAMNVIGNAADRESDAGSTTGLKIHTSRSGDENARY